MNPSPRTEHIATTGPDWAIYDFFDSNIVSSAPTVFAPMHLLLGTIRYLSLW